jgi:hypothetical protein
MSLDISRPGNQRDALNLFPHPGVTAPDAREQAMTDHELHCRDVLALWLRWNEAYQRSTELMFAGDQSPEQIELLMDQMDQLRQQAVQMSRELLE